VREQTAEISRAVAVQGRARKKPGLTGLTEGVFRRLSDVDVIDQLVADERRRAAEQVRRSGPAGARPTSAFHRSAAKDFAAHGHDNDIGFGNDARRRGAIVNSRYLAEDPAVRHAREEFHLIVAVFLVNADPSFYQHTQVGVLVPLAENSGAPCARYALPSVLARNTRSDGSNSRTL